MLRILTNQSELKTNQIFFYLFIRDHHSGPLVRFEPQAFQCKVLDEIQPGVTALPHGKLMPHKIKFNQVAFSTITTIITRLLFGSFPKLISSHFLAKWLKKECFCPFFSYCLIFVA
jgi:hypothetical protein